MLKEMYQSDETYNGAMSSLQDDGKKIKHKKCKIKMRISLFLLTYCTFKCKFFSFKDI